MLLSVDVLNRTKYQGPHRMDQTSPWCFGQTKRLLIIHSTVNGQLVSPFWLVIENNASINTGVQIFLWVPLPLVLDIHPEVKFLGNMIILWLIFEESTTEWMYHFTFPPGIQKSSNFSTFLFFFFCCVLNVTWVNIASGLQIAVKPFLTARVSQRLSFTLWGQVIWIVLSVCARG